MYYFNKIKGAAAFTAKAKIATEVNSYAEIHSVVGGKETVARTWVKEFNLVAEADRAKLTEEILDLCETMERQEITSINRMGYHKLKASNTGTKILDTFKEKFGQMSKDLASDL